MSTADINTVAADYRNSVSTKYVGVAAFTVLVWDHIITFSDEVEYIWKGGKGLAVYLFLVNRYVIPLGFIVNIWAYFSTSWTQQSCSHFVRYEGSMTMIGVTIAFIMMFLRVRALYRAFRSIQALVFAILLTFISVNSYVLTHGIPVVHPDPSLVDSCTMIVDPRIGRLLTSSTASLPLLYDTVVVSLTLYRTASSVYSKTASNLLRVLLREGLLYYSVLCTITLILTIMINSSTQSIRNSTSQLHLCLTVAMVSRITLDLKRYANRSSNTDIVYHDAAPQFHRHRHHQEHYLSTVTQPGMSFAPPPALSTLSNPPQPKVRPLPPVPRISRAADAAELENGSYLAMETFSTAMPSEV